MSAFKFHWVREGNRRKSQGQNRTREIRLSGIAGGLVETCEKARAIFLSRRCHFAFGWLFTFQPRMATESQGPPPTRMLEPPGFMGLHYGRRTPLTALAAHVIFGVILGSFYKLAGS